MLPSTFFPGILLARKPPESQVEDGSGFRKETMVGKNGLGKSTLRIAPL